MKLEAHEKVFQRRVQGAVSRAAQASWRMKMENSAFALLASAFAKCRS